MIHFRIDEIYLIIKVILCQLLFSFFFTGVLSSQVQCLVHNKNCILVYVSKLGEIILGYMNSIINLKSLQAFNFTWQYGILLFSLIFNEQNLLSILSYSAVFFIYIFLMLI